MSYYGSVAARAFTETKNVWNLHRFLGVLGAPSSGILLHLITKGKTAVIGWQDIILPALFAYAVCFVLSYLIIFVRAPAIMDRERRITIAALTEENSSLRSNGVLTRQQERQIDSVRERLTNFSDEEKAVLRFILDNGAVDYAQIMAAGFQSALVFEARKKGKAYALITETHTQIHGPMERYFGPRSLSAYQINPAIESPLRKILDEPSDGPVRLPGQNAKPKEGASGDKKL